MKTLDCPLKNRQWSRWTKTLSRWKPDFIAIGIRNLDNSDSEAFRSYLGAPRRMVDIIRRVWPSCKIILGGSAVTVDPPAVLSAVGGDHLVLGEGEQALPDLLHLLEHGGPAPTIYDDHGAPFRVAGLESLPLPQLHRWFDMKPYLSGDAGYPVQTKRGCPLNCTYCTYARIEGRKYRFIPPAHVADEIEGALERGIDTFEFVDSTFNLPPAHAKAVVQACLERELRANYVGTGINPARLDSALARDMARLGFQTVIVTAESASEKMLESYRKGFSQAALRSTHVILKDAGIQTMWVFLLGGAGETMESTSQTLDYIDQHIRAPDVAYITSGIRLYPEAPMHRDWLAGRYADADVTTSTAGTPFFMSSSLPPGWLRARLQEFQRSHPNVMLSEESQGRAIQWAMSVLRLFNAPKPYWKYLPWLGQLRNCWPALKDLSPSFH